MGILDYADIIEDFSTTTFEEWQAKRVVQTTLGGSEAGIILGLNNFKDEYTLYLEKIGELEPAQAGEAAAWGHALEPVVAEQWYKRIGQPQGLEIEEFTYLLQSKEHTFMSANIDRLIRRGEHFGILEVKTASEYLKDEWESGEILANGSGSGRAPAKYYAQLQHYFAVTGCEWGYFAALIGGNKLYSVYVERNEPFIQDLIEKELLFTERVNMRIPPDINGSNTCKELIGKLYKKHDDTFDEVEDDLFGQWILSRNELKAEIERLTDEHKAKIAPLEEELALYENSMKAQIAEHKGVTWQGWKITWSERAGRKTADVKLLEEKYPDIAKEVIKQGESYRALTVSKPKQKKELSHK